ncbi:hypothetical protein DFH27DRAFT_215262 [Peziza echinospora]|nr:hypothetical protein DFH27DRAFT_215262 [Peziza echinospora]
MRESLSLWAPSRRLSILVERFQQLYPWIYRHVSLHKPQASHARLERPRNPVYHSRSVDHLCGPVSLICILFTFSFCLGEENLRPDLSRKEAERSGWSRTESPTNTCCGEYKDVLMVCPRLQAAIRRFYPHSCWSASSLVMWTWEEPFPLNSKLLLFTPHAQGMCGC